MGVAPDALVRPYGRLAAKAVTQSRIDEVRGEIELERDLLLRQLQTDYFEKTRELDKIALRLD